MNSSSTPPSPHWSGQTKLVAALTAVAFILLLAVSSLGMVGPMLLAFIAAYIFFPVAKALQKVLKSWRWSVTLVYLLVVFLLIGLLTWGSITLIAQVESLVRFLQNTFNNLPQFLREITQQPLIIGPFSIDLRQFDLTTLAQQLITIVQPILAQAGTLVGTIASSAATLVGWLFFAIIVSYFVLAESKGKPGEMIKFQVPGYEEDFRRFTQQLATIWNAFLRGQLTMITIAIFLHGITLGILGVNFYIGLGVISGILRLIPLIGSPISWIVFLLVAVFQGYTSFGLDPTSFVIIVVAISIFVDIILDNVIAPYIFSNALRIHPAAVLVAALVAANWLGFIGLVLAAPVLATLKLFALYTFRKMIDDDPWATLDLAPSPSASFRQRIQSDWNRFMTFLRTQGRWLRARFSNNRKP